MRSFSRPHARRAALIATLAAATVARPASAASFQPVGRLSGPRVEARATLLADGGVLVTGGRAFDGRKSVALASAERFDPVTQQFALLPPMQFERVQHASVRLRDGRVLIVGGAYNFSRPTAVAPAEIFDPATGRFALSGSLIETRTAHTATLLPDGRVLVAAGWSKNGPVKTAELFDPASGAFQPAGRMARARSGHTAIALADGRVAILGGFDGNQYSVRDIEIYDPATGTFVRGGELAEDRGDFTATLLPDGRVLIVGGLRSSRGSDRVTGSVEIYDPGTGRSAVVENLPETRGLHAAATLVDGRVLVVGGVSHFRARPEDHLRTAFLIDPVTRKATATEPMAGPRAWHAAVALADGRVLVLGGGDRLDRALDTAEVYVP